MSYPRETKEFLPVSVKLKQNGVETKITFGIEFAVLRPGVRPSLTIIWLTPTLLDGDVGIMINEFALGTWLIWARVTSLPEVPVIYCGDFSIT